MVVDTALVEREATVCVVAVQLHTAAWFVSCHYPEALYRLWNVLLSTKREQCTFVTEC